jgi:hypothetical protein
MRGRELWCPVVILVWSVFPWHCLSVTRIGGTLHEYLRSNIYDSVSPNSSCKVKYFRQTRIENHSIHFIYEVYSADSRTSWIIIYSFVLLTWLFAPADFIVFCRRDTLKIFTIHFMLINFFYRIVSYISECGKIWYNQTYSKVAI